MTTLAPTGLALIQRPQEVEASLWRRLRFENEGRCRERLFERHLPLARSLAMRELRRRPQHGLERNDFEQLAIAGLLEAIDRFDPLLGPPFSAFAKHRIRGAIADGIARSSESGAQYNFRRRLELERLQSLSKGEASGDLVTDLSKLAIGLAIGFIAERSQTADQVSNPYESNAWRDVEQSVEREIERLPEAERSIMVQHYKHHVAFNDIAKLLGLSKGRISQLHRAAIARIRERLAISD